MSTPQIGSLEQAIKAYEESLNRSNFAVIERDFEQPVDPPEEPKKMVYLAIIQMCEYLNAWNVTTKDDSFLAAVERELNAAEARIDRNPLLKDLKHLVLYCRGFLLRARAQHSEAFEAFKLSAELNSDFYRAAIQMAAQLIYLDKPDAARERLKAVANLPDNNPAYVFTRWALARIDFGEGNYNAAINLLDEVLEKKGSSWFHVAYKASALALEAERLLTVLKNDFGISTIRDVVDRENLNPSGKSKFVSETRERLRQGLIKAGMPE